MLFRRQLEWIQVKVVGRFAIDLDHLAIDDELNLRDLGLPARIDRDDLSIDDFFLRRRLKVVGDPRRQGGNLKLGAQLSHIAFDILNRDVQLILARLLRLRLDRVRFIGRDHFTVNGVFDALNILVSAYLNSDLRIFGDGFGEDVVGQEKQRYRYRRAQCAVARGRLAVGGNHIQREVVTLAIGRHIDAQADDVLAAEEKSQVAVDIAQFFRLGRIIKFGIGFPRNRFQETPVNRPAQANRIYRHTVDRGGADALVAAVLADIAILAAIAEDDHRFPLQRRLNSGLDTQQRRVIQGGLAAISQVVDRADQALAVGRVIHHQADITAETDDGDWVVRAERLQVAARGRLRQRQRLVRHTAAGVNHQDAGKIQIVIGDILDAGDLRQADQVSADGKILGLQSRNQLPARIQYAGVDRHLR